LETVSTPPTPPFIPSATDVVNLMSSNQAAASFVYRHDRRFRRAAARFGRRCYGIPEWSPGRNCLLASWQPCATARWRVEHREALHSQHKPASAARPQLSRAAGTECHASEPLVLRRSHRRSQSPRGHTRFGVWPVAIHGYPEALLRAAENHSERPKYPTAGAPAHGRRRRAAERGGNFSRSEGSAANGRGVSAPGYLESKRSQVSFRVQYCRCVQQSATVGQPHRFRIRSAIEAGL